MGGHNRQQVFLLQSGRPEGIQEGSASGEKELSAILSLKKLYSMMFREDNYPRDF